MKSFKDLTDEEKALFFEEINRMLTFGSACLTAASKNANEDVAGWPFISISNRLNNSEVSLCDAFDALHNITCKLTVRNIIVPFFLSNGKLPDSEVVMEAIIHNLMHDAFFLGVAAVTMMEMSFAGVEDVLRDLQNGKDDV